MGFFSFVFGFVRHVSTSTFASASTSISNVICFNNRFSPQEKKFIRPRRYKTWQLAKCIPVSVSIWKNTTNTSHLNEDNYDRCLLHNGIGSGNAEVEDGLSSK